MDSILTSIKRLSGISKDCLHFDDQIVAYINSVFLVLRQLGVGPAAGFVITDESAIWSDFISDDIVLRESIKSYMSAKVRLQFDPPSNSAHLQALTSTISEFEWRLNIDAESVNTDVDPIPVINDKSARLASVTLLAANWKTESENFHYQIVTIEGTTQYSKVDLLPSAQQLNIFHNKDVSFVTENEDGIIKVFAIGDKPILDYTMQVSITEVVV